MSTFTASSHDGAVEAKDNEAQRGGGQLFASMICAHYAQGQHRIGVDQGPNVLVEPLQKITRVDDVTHLHPKHTARIDAKKDPAWVDDYVYLYDLLGVSPSPTLLIGGDHSIGMPSVAASLDKVDDVSNLYVLWIDAHADINTFEASGSKNYHGMPLASVLGLEKPWFPIRGCLSFKNLLYFGLRDVDTFEQDVVRDHDVFYTSDTKQMLVKIESILTENPNAKFHVSWDVDSMDPTFVSSTGCYCEDGLAPEAVIAVLRAVKANLLAMDLTEFNPSMGNEERSLQTVLDVMDAL